uniref:Abi family protein n=1 Tax=Lactococcus garvieae TaxID=1363 RepID=UPI00359C1F40
MKLAKSYEEQLEILSNRGLIIENEEKAIHALSNINYYNLTGYLFQLKKKDGTYKEGVSFEQGLSLYNFDKEIHAWLLAILTEIEQSIKTKTAYIIAINYPDNPCIYEDETFFKNQIDHQRFIKEFKKNVQNNSGAEFVKHHILHYDNHFPIWVAVQLFTMGNLKAMYTNLSSTLRKQISREFDSSPVMFDNWLECIRILRNLVAHNMRLYGYNFILMPKTSDKFEKTPTNQLFGHLFLLKHLYFDNDEWIEKVMQLQKIVSKYFRYIELEKVGFTKNWFEKLIIQ